MGEIHFAPTFGNPAMVRFICNCQEALFSSIVSFRGAKGFRNHEYGGAYHKCVFDHGLRDRNR